MVAVPGHGEGPPERRAAPPACAPRVSNHCPARPRGPLGPLLGPWAFATCVLGMRSERLGSRARSRGRWGLRGRGQGLLQVSASTWTAPGEQVSMESGGLVPRGSQLQMHPHQGGDPEGGHRPGFRRFPGGRSPGSCPGPAPPGPARVRRPLSVRGKSGQDRGRGQGSREAGRDGLSAPAATAHSGFVCTGQGGLR